MAEQPDNREALMEGLLGDIKERVETSQASHKMSPEKRKLEDTEKRISKRSWGESTTDIDIQAKKSKMKSRATRQGFGSRRTARGQVRLHGSAGEEPDS